MNVMHPDRAFLSRNRPMALGPREKDGIARADIERMAKTLAGQNGAPKQEWPRFVDTAQSLIRLSQRWTQGC